MEQHLLENGLKTVSDYCLGYSKHVQASYERACRVIREFYGELGFEEYNPVHDDEIMNQVLAGRTLTPESSYMFCRYVFRVLGMMKIFLCFFHISAHIWDMILWIILRTTFIWFLII